MVDQDWSPNWDDRRGHFILCNACTKLDHCRMGITSELAGESFTVDYELTCSVANEGGPGVAHGGWTAGVLDELLGHVPVLNEQLAVTARLEVSFVKPVPVAVPLAGRAWLEKREGRRWYVSGGIYLPTSGAELANATGIFVERDDGHFARHAEWMASQGTPPDEARVHSE